MTPRTTKKVGKVGRPRTADTLSVDGLARTFGAAAPLGRRGVATLLDALRAGGAAPERSLSAWRARYGAVCGYDLSAPAAARGPRAALAEAFALPADTGTAELLFAVHSFYALLLQLLAVAALAPEDTPLAALRDGEAAVRRFLHDLATGATPRALGVDGLLDDDLFTWFSAALTPALSSLCGELAGRIASFDGFHHWAGQHLDDKEGILDPLKGLYQALFPRKVRHGLGEFYTPDWLAEHVLDQLGYYGDPTARLLDPACGSGTFLLAALRRARRRGLDAAGARRLCENIVGFDLNPLAALAARVNFLIAVRDLPGVFEKGAPPLRAPVYLCDSILSPFGRAQRSEAPFIDAAQLLSPRWTEAGPLFQRAALPPRLPPFDYIAGNPPWVLWDNLPADYRAATRPLWQHYGLFTLSGKDARHGGGKKDLAALMLYACADAYLRDGGHLGFVITQTLFQTRGAGDGFRRFRLGADGPHLGVQRVDDLVALQPFPGASTRTSTLVLVKGQPTRYPVPYHRWRPQGAGRRADDVTIERLWAAPTGPVGADADPRAPWLLQPDGVAAPTGPAPRQPGDDEYHAHAGAYSGGQNGVYWLELLGPVGEPGPGLVRVRNRAEASKGGLRGVERVLEAASLFPLLRWGDLRPFCAEPAGHLLLVQDAERRRGVPEPLLAEEQPRTLAYLREFEPELRARAAYRRYFRPDSDAPFYTMYDVGPYTLSPWKTVWRRMDRRLGAAVIGPRALPGETALRPVVPQETCVLIAAASEAEAHYLCGLLSSAVLAYQIEGQSVRGGKSFGSPGMLAGLRLPRYRPGDAVHEALVDGSRAAHALARRLRQADAAPDAKSDPALPAALQRELSQARATLDEPAAALYGVPSASLAAMRGALAQP